MATKYLMLKATLVAVLGVVTITSRGDARRSGEGDHQVCSDECGTPQPEWGRQFCADHGYSIGGMCMEAGGPFNECIAAGHNYEVSCRD
jgi:hypothetical protein